MSHKSSTVTKKTIQRDSWSANPYKPSDPRYEEFQDLVKKGHREQLANHLDPTLLRQYRIHDFTKAALLTSTNANSTNINKGTSVSGDGAEELVMHHCHPTPLQSPQSFVERTIEADDPSCHVALQGGSLSMVCTKKGEVIVRNGFTAEPVASFMVTEEIEDDEKELKTFDRMSRRMYREDRMKGVPPRKVPKRGAMYICDKDEQARQDKTKEGVYAIAAEPLGESIYVALLLNNETVRIYHALTLRPVVEVSLVNVAREKVHEEKTKENDNDENESTGDKFGKIVALNTHKAPMTFLVMLENRAVILSLKTEDNSIGASADCTAEPHRPELVISRSRSYAKLKLKFVAASVNDICTLIYASCDKGSLWWIDLEDLLVVDSLPVEAPKLRVNENTPFDFSNIPVGRRRPGAVSPSPTPSRKKAKEEEVNKSSGEIFTAIGAHKGWIIAGTSKGRITAYLKQSFGEKPLMVLDEEVISKNDNTDKNAKIKQRDDKNTPSDRVIYVAPDDRECCFWCVTEGGSLTYWSLQTYELVFSTTVSVSAVKSAMFLPHTISSKVWALTTSGINSVFVAESNQPMERMISCKTEMSLVLANQHNLRPIKENDVFNAEETMAVRLEAVVQNYQSNAVEVIIRCYYYKWMNFKHRAVARRNRGATAQCIGALAHKNLMRMVYVRLVNNTNANRASKQRSSMVNHIALRCDEVILRRYYIKMQSLVRIRKDESHEKRMFVYMKRVTDNIVQIRDIVNTWARFVDKKKFIRVRKNHAAYGGRFEELKRIGHCFQMWSRFMKQRSNRRRALRRCAVLNAGTNRIELKKAFAKWACFSHLVHRKKCRELWFQSGNSAVGRVLMGRYFNYLRAHRNSAIEEKNKKSLHDVKAKHDEVDKQYKTIIPNPSRLVRLRQLQETVANLKKEKAILLEDVSQLDSHVSKLKTDISSKSELTNKANIEKILEEEVGQKSENLTDEEKPALEECDVKAQGEAVFRRLKMVSAMARVRSVVLNTDQDLHLMEKIMSSAVSGTKMFSRLWYDICNILGQSTMYASARKDDGDEENKSEEEFTANGTSDLSPTEVCKWNLGATESSIHNYILETVPSYTYPAFLDTIKKCTIAFDRISPAELEHAFPLGAEVQANVEDLMTVAYVLKCYKEPEVVNSHQSTPRAPSPKKSRKKGSRSVSPKGKRAKSKSKSTKDDAAPGAPRATSKKRSTSKKTKVKSTKVKSTTGKKSESG
eukprot:Tbor_TRINITY_DN4683_c0_g1::TRINITY_DN4683_c0_g1_i1::g.14832::m.14832